MKRRRRLHRGSILIFVLAVLAMMTILGGTLSRSAYNRSWSVRQRIPDPGSGREPHGGTWRPPRATIADGANVAPSN